MQLDVVRRVAGVDRGGVSLRSAQLDLRDFERRSGEITLGRDVLDHQLIDVDGVRLVRASDLYLAPFAGTYRLVGVDVWNFKTADGRGMRRALDMVARQAERLGLAPRSELLCETATYPSPFPLERQMRTYVYDGGGSVRQLTNSAGAVTDEYLYDAFGNSFTKTGTTPTITCIAANSTTPT